jgi:hypothetical protein
MSRHPIALLIEKADEAINQEDFDTVVGFYTDDAVLVVKPGQNVIGKAQIRLAMERIAAHFDRSLDVRQAGLTILETETPRSYWLEHRCPRRTVPWWNARQRTCSGRTPGSGSARSTTRMVTKCSTHLPDAAVPRRFT